MSNEDEAFSISEVLIQPGSYCAGKQIKLIKLLEKARITCVIHKGKMVIPTGQTVINADDKILLLSAKECHDEAIAMMSEVRDE